MNAFTKRYFTWIALVFLVFSLFSYLDNKIKIFLFFAFFALAFALFLRSLRKKERNLTLVCVLLAAAALIANVSSDINAFRTQKMTEKYLGAHELEGYVREVSGAHEFMSELIVRVERADGEDVSLDMVFVTEFGSELSRGDFFTASVTVLPLSEYTDAEYLRNNNEYKYPVVAVIKKAESIEMLDGGFRLPLVLSSLNSRLSARLQVGLGKRDGSLASTLLLGNRGLLSDSTLRDFKRAGIYHMLALSGLHVAILMGVFEWLLQKLYVPKSARIVLLAAFSLFYIALTGFLLSACRAMLMLWAAYLSFIMGRSRDSLTALFMAVSLIVLIEPCAVLDIGLQLSFLSTFGVIASSMIGAHVPFLKNRDKSENPLIKMLRRSAGLLLTSLCVFVATLPIITVYFGEVSLATFFTNILAGFICEAFMVLSLIFLVFYKISLVAVPVGFFAHLAGGALTLFVELFSDIPGVMLSLLYPFTAFLAFALFLASVALFGMKLKKKWLLAVPSIAFAVLFVLNVGIFTLSRSDKVVAEYASGDMLVLSSNEGVYICDASDGGSGGFYDAISLARSNCFTEIDGVILTHYHSDHQRALNMITDNFKLSRVLAPMPQTEDEWHVLSSISRTLEQEDVKLYVYEPQESIDLLSGTLNVTPRAYGAGEKHPSLALSYSYGEGRITLITPPYFDSYLAKSGAFDEYVYDSDVLIVGAHGRRIGDGYSLFSKTKEGCEVLIFDLATLELSDFEKYIDTRRIILGAEYKKSELK